LLISVAKEKANDLVEGLQKVGAPAAAMIGEIVADTESRITVIP
jgi:hydrogenase maturation factor